MEAAPLTTAFALGSKAVSSLHTTPASAIQQHEAAACEFAAAAQGVHDAEALRMLELLQRHHEQAARTIHLRSSSQAQANSTSFSSPLAPDGNGLSTEIGATPEQGVRQFQHQKTPSPNSLRPPRRGLPSSIASNLASARGIPSGQRHGERKVTPSTIDPGSGSATQDSAAASRPASTTEETYPDREHAANVAPQPTRSHASMQPVAVAPNEPEKARSPLSSSIAIPGDEMFLRFYSGWGGLVSKLSAPLAFAGLPLSPKVNVAENVPVVETPEHNSSTATASVPDMTSIYSKAAIRAIKHDHPGLAGVQESFFVVPTEGGMASYAGVLSKAERQPQRRTRDSRGDLDQENDHFVDATESPQSRVPPKSPSLRRDAAAQPARSSTGKSMEELEMENVELKQVTDNLSRRLYMWEKSAQSQSLALQQSIRTLQPPSRGASDLSTDSASSSEVQKSKQLEEQVKRLQQTIDSMRRENDKLKTVVMRYRERWEKLKEGARTRRGTGGAALNGDAAEDGVLQAVE